LFSSRQPKTQAPTSTESSKNSSETSSNSTLERRAAQNRHGKDYASRMTDRGKKPWIGDSMLEYDLPTRPHIERPVKPAKGR
jgi:hypothetical protein